MNKLLWNLLKVTPALIGASLVTANSAFAQTVNGTSDPTGNTLEQIDRYNEQDSNQPMSQVTNVNQLRDVSPTDWAYEALRSLVDRYGCIVGYPNQTYRGNQALSRYEFAAGLNACLNQIERLIASSESVLREDLDTINRLTQEFEAELATLGGRVDDLESRTAFLEDHQFSTTTKLKGEVIFALTDSFGNDDNTQTTFSDRVRLNFDTSFTGEDLLTTRLQAGNVPNYGDEITSPSDMSRLGFDTNTDNELEIDNLYYRFNVGEKLTAYVGVSALDLDDIFNVANPVLESSGTGALSRFNRYDPILYRGVEGAGLGLTYELIEDELNLTALYLGDDGQAADPSEGNGIFNGSYSAGAQASWTVTDKLDIAATYVYEYQSPGNVDLTGGAGSRNGENPYDDDSAARAHQVGLSSNYRLSDTINFGVWGSVSFTSELGGDGNADYFTVNGHVDFLDLGKEGAVLSFAGGVPPKAYSTDDAANENGTSVLIEGLYKFPLNDNILITPGAYVILNPDHNDDNDTEVVGVIRTTFKF
jgi:hypothetical protein